MEEQKIYGGEKNAMIVSVRGLFSNWKQIIYYDFKGRISKTFIMDTITELHHNGINIVAVVTDMGSNNQGMWKELGICRVRKGKILKTSFSHPVTKKCVDVCRFSPPHKTLKKSCPGYKNHDSNE